MDKVSTVNAYGVSKEPNTFRIRRMLPGSIEQVWAYLTENDLRRQWLAAGNMELKVGAPVEFIWRNDELNNPPSKRPDGFPEEQRMQGRVTEIDPLHKLSIAWDGFGEVSYALERKGDDVLLTMIQRGLPNRDIIVMFAAGSHTHFDILDALLQGEALPDFWKGWSRLQKEYDQRISNN